MTDNDALNIFHIGFSSEVDGPGMRMVIYLKGCNLHCPWCAAPESISPAAQMLFYPQRAENLLKLPSACPYGAITLHEAGNLLRDCTKCQQCQSLICTTDHSRAYEKAGEWRSIESLRTQAARYRRFFAAGGGITIGGGEPGCQLPALQKLLALLYKDGINITLESNGTNADLPLIYPLLNLLYIDLKHPDSDIAADITGQGNETVLANIAARYQQRGKMIVRIPLIPGFNSDENSLRRFAALLRAIGPLTVEILPYHQRGIAKWQACGTTKAAGYITPTNELLTQARLIISKSGLLLQE